MGIKERRDIEIAEMKKRIIDAAIELIEEEGYEKLSIRKIAAKIEYSPTTLYLYYKDKAEIIADMSAEIYSKVEEGAAAIINNSSELPIDRQLHDILCMFIKCLCSEPEMARAIMYSGSNVIFAKDCEYDQPANPGIAMLDQMIDEGISQKILRPGAANTSWMIISALIGFVMGVVENKFYEQENFDRMLEDFVDILIRGIRQ